MDTYPQKHTGNVPVRVDAQAALAHVDALFGYVLSMVRSQADAEEVMQQLFLRLSRGSRHLPSGESLRPYLFRCARNEALNFIEARRRQGVMVNSEQAGFELLESRASDALSLLERRERVQRVNAALRRLPPEQLEVVILRQFEELTFEQIAQIVQASMQTCFSRYTYALNKLKEMLPHDRI